MSVIMGLRRWRRNPLRRTTDLLEAWVALAAALLLILGAPAAGVICGALVDSSLQRTARLQHEQRHQTTVTVLGASPDRHRRAYDPESPRPQDRRSQVSAKWRAADGSTHSGTLKAPGHDPRTGNTFRIWTDTHGKPAKGPMDAIAARIHAVLAGLCAAALAAVLVMCARRLLVWRLVRRRYRQLDRAWAKVGPDWGRTGADS